MWSVPYGIASFCILILWGSLTFDLRYAAVGAVLGTIVAAAGIARARATIKADTSVEVRGFCYVGIALCCLSLAANAGSWIIIAIDM